MISLIKIKYQRMFSIKFEFTVERVHYFLESSIFDLKNGKILDIHID